jgi:hypothetical protein
MSYRNLMCVSESIFKKRVGIRENSGLLKSGSLAQPRANILPNQTCCPHKCDSFLLAKYDLEIFSHREHQYRYIGIGIRIRMDPYRSSIKLPDSYLDPHSKYGSG